MGFINRENYPLLDDYKFGTVIVDLTPKMIKKFSYKDLLLLLGILVAVIVTLTTLVYKENSTEANSIAPAPPLPKASSMTEPLKIANKLFEKVVMISASQSAPSSR
jgi:hypothetical protein